MTKKILAWSMGPDGAIQPVTINASSFDDASRLLPGGVYTTFRTYKSGKVLGVSDHLERLRESTKILGANIELDEKRLKQLMRVAIYDKTFYFKRIRLQINLTQQPVGQIFILLEELHVPNTQDYLHGVSVSTRSMHRENALAKSTQFIHTAKKVRNEILTKDNEVLMIGEGGEILEGLSSNFFGVIQGKVWTAEFGVLHGITRKLALMACEQSGVEVVMQPVHLDMLPAISEAFITSASRGILPVAKIDGQIVGNGTPGEVTKTVSLAYESIVEGILETI